MGKPKEDSEEIFEHHEISSFWSHTVKEGFSQSRNITAGKVFISCAKIVQKINQNMLKLACPQCMSITQVCITPLSRQFSVMAENLNTCFRRDCYLANLSARAQNLRSVYHMTFQPLIKAFTSRTTS